MSHNRPEVSLCSELVDCDDSVLILIDIQDYFLRKLPHNDGKLLVSRITWLASVAAMLDVPFIATAEDMPRLGNISPAVAEALPPATVVHDKTVFGLADQADILAAVEVCGRRTAVLVGLETDVCVAHSALGLLRRGFQVVVVEDAVASPGEAHERGLERMRRAGALITGAKSLYYEWVRTVARDNALTDAHRRVPVPAGLRL
jgi:nicotinamidase-related amidase